MLIADARRLAIDRATGSAQIPSLEHVFVIGDAPGDGRRAPFSELDRAMPAIPGCRSRRSTRTTCSRSSTRRARPGKPKGATVTHRQAIANLQNIIVLGVAAGDARHAAARGRGRAAVGVAARRAAVPRDRLPVDDDARATRPARKVVLMPVGRFDPDVAMQTHRTREGHGDRRRAHDHVAHPRVAEPRQVRPLVGEARVVRRRAGRARARRAHRRGVPAHAQDADDRVRAHRDRVGRDRARRRRLLRASRARSGAPRRPSSCASSTTTGTTRRRASGARSGSRARP